jgi:hypothetical protein
LKLVAGSISKSFLLLTAAAGGRPAAVFFLKAKRMTQHRNFGSGDVAEQRRQRELRDNVQRMQQQQAMQQQANGQLRAWIFDTTRMLYVNALDAVTKKFLDEGSSAPHREECRTIAAASNDQAIWLGEYLGILKIPRPEQAVVGTQVEEVPAESSVIVLP